MAARAEGEYRVSTVYRYSPTNLFKWFSSLGRIARLSLPGRQHNWTPACLVGLRGLGGPRPTRGLAEICRAYHGMPCSQLTPSVFLI